MKNLLFTLLLPVIGFTQVSINPSTIEINQQITITVDINTTDSDCNGMNNPNKVYLPTVMLGTPQLSEIGDKMMVLVRCPITAMELGVLLLFLNPTII
jgi:hypothetical protein